MAYATVDDVKARTDIDFDDAICETLLEDASYIIDTFNSKADENVKRIVVCRMVVRALPSETEMPIGANQATTSALGYSQTWTMSQGTSGELYLNRLEKKMLGCYGLIGSRSPIEDMA